MTLTTSTTSLATDSIRITCQVALDQTTVALIRGNDRRAIAQSKKALREFRKLMKLATA